MLKRILSIVLCVCLSVLCIGVQRVSPVAVAEGTVSDTYILEEIPCTVTGTKIAGGGAVMESGVSCLFAPSLDFTQMGYNEGTLALQMDIYTAGDNGLVTALENGRVGGQIELTSGGTCDVEEIYADTTRLRFKRDTWVRQILPLSVFVPLGGGTFDPTAVNFFRIYLAQPYDTSLYGQKATIKIVNIRLVNTAVAAPSIAEDPVGDGTFRPEAPEWKPVTYGEGYDTAAVAAGYNLKDYALTHGLFPNTPDFDWTPVFTSLVDGLQETGGGVLFIPAGEYIFYGTVYVPRGVTVCGEWTSPEQDPTVRGTVLKVYDGRGNERGTPFMHLHTHAQVQNLTFWYPEQEAGNVVPYPPTVLTGQYTFVKNVTMVNSYFGIRQSNVANCPNASNIYGTPLRRGVDMDMVIDIARIEELHFSPDYWIRSGLPGAPTGAQADLLRAYVYQHAEGITLRRIDWSYLTHSNISGYRIGLHFTLSSDGNYPNGQCVGLNFNGCFIAVQADNVQSTTESLADITVRDCVYGLYLPRDPSVDSAAQTSYTQRGSLRGVNLDISATDYAVWQNNGVQLSLLSSVIRRGAVVSSSGHMLIGDTRFHTAAPQVILQPGAASATLLGNTATTGDFTWQNNAGCTVHAGTDPLNISDKMYTPLTDEEAAAQDRRPTSQAVYVAALDNSGATDVTEALQTLLTDVAESGGVVFLPPGKYLLGGALTVPTGVELRGAGDFGSMPAPVNTILVVPDTAAVEAAAQYTAAATVTLEEHAGLRGVTFHYPAQCSEYAEVTVNGVSTYDFTFTPYPYAVRGTGAGVYLINVTSHNGYNGVDLATYRCDDHYIDYLAGHFFNRGIVVGGGSEGGVIRNYQFNYNAILHAYNSVWGPWGCVPQNEEMMNHFHLALQRQLTNNAIVLQLGDVADQLVYDCFNYGCMYGVQFITDPQTGKAPRGVRLFGHGVDYATESIRIEAGTDIQIMNLQLTAFNQKGSDITGEYAVTDKDIYDLHLTDTFTGEITVWNFTEWAPDPTAAVRVDGGKLNVYNGAFNNDNGEFFDINNKTMVDLVAFTTRHGGTPRVTPKDCIDYVRMIGGHYATALKYHSSTIFGLEIESNFPTTNLQYMQSWTNAVPTDFATYFAEGGTVTAYSARSAAVTLPATLDGQTVSVVGDGTNAVSKNVTPTSVYVPTTVTAILPHAFAADTAIVYGGNAAQWAAVEGSAAFTNVTLCGCAHDTTVTVKETEATCFSAGYSGDTVCADCDARLSVGETLEPHATELRGYVAPTCTETGLSDGVWCTVCEIYLTEREVIPAHRTEYREQIHTVCTEPGIAAGVWCTVCEKYIEGGEPIAPHETVRYEQRDATCTQYGTAAGVWCTVCKKYIEGGQMLAPHRTEQRDGFDATCTDAGHTAGVWCTECEKYISGEAIPAHATELRPPQKATCTEAGRMAGTWCNVCEKYIDGGAVIPAHTKEERPEIPPTATETGRTAGVWCTVCEEYVEGGEVIPKLSAALLGNVNGDKQINSTDARLVLQLAVGKIQPSDIDVTVADVDGNGKVNSTDARLILQYAVGKITEFSSAT